MNFILVFAHSYKYIRYLTFTAVVERTGDGLHTLVCYDIQQF